MALAIVLAQPVVGQVADFTADVTTGCFPLTVKFTDTSTGSPSSWAWTFGNGNSSPLQNPSAVFSAPGEYEVSLTVSNGGSPKTKTGFIKVYGPPTVDFSFDATTGCAPLSVNFQDKTSTSSGSVTNWFWVFGDGGTSQSANPTYIFQQPGSYTVSLKARNQHGCESTKTVEPAIVVKGPRTAFSPSSIAVCTLPATFSFEDATTGTGAITYQWNFGDGQTSTAASPVHTYNSAASYNVVLKSRDETGCESSITHKVFAGSEAGVQFTTSPDPVCPGRPVKFTAISTDPIASYLWTFGNGKTSTQISPATTYEEAGVHQVTLKAQMLNHECASIVTQTVDILQPAVPILAKSIDCSLNLTLISNSKFATHVEWYIDDVLVSKSIKLISPIHLPGNQTVRLVAFNAAGCDYATEEIVTLIKTPTANFSPDELYTCKPDKTPLAGCAPFTVNFVNKSVATFGTTYLWTFGDGSTSTATSPTHVFTTKGTYQVTLKASNIHGCFTTKQTTVKVNNVAPVANFDVDKTLACAGEPITFTDNSQGAEFWCWNFGDGWITDGKLVVHQYATPGTYTVTLTASNGCNGIATRTNLITIKNPNVSFLAAKACESPFDVQLTNLSSNYDALSWDFGDGQTSTDLTISSHHYAAEGQYDLKLIGTNISTGCTTISLLPLTIQQVSAQFTVDNEKPCAGIPISFTDESHAAVKWTWTLGPYSSRQPNFSAALFTPGNYLATLEVKDSDSCRVEKTIPIEVLNMHSAFSFDATSSCENFTVAFKDQSTGTPSPTSWLWEFGDGQTSIDRNPQHVYTAQGAYDVNLRISNSEGSCVFTKEDAIEFQVPVPNFSVEKANFCVNEPITFANTSERAASFEWFFGDGQTSQLQSPEITYNVPGPYAVTLFATDAYGCEQKIVKPAIVNIVSPIANFSVDKNTGTCPPFTATFKDLSTPEIAKWQWAFGDGKTSNLKDPVNIYVTAGNFNVLLEVTDVNGCRGSKESPQFVNVGGPSGSFGTSIPSSCTNRAVTFDASTINTVNMTWDFGDGVVLDKVANAVTHLYNSTGAFKPSLILTDANGCKVPAAAPTEVVVRDTTVIETIITPGCLFRGDALKLAGQTEADDLLAWTWTINGITAGVGDDISVTIEDPGAHEVIGYATNEFGCTTSVSTQIHVQAPIDIIPDVITPNGDRWNPTFDFPGLDNSKWDISIVNRWGRVVYEETNYAGTWNGGDQPAGVYYYILRNALCEGLNYKGYVTVAR
ncbi:MAG TPA: PKD domain-containing protein [Cyclobacteriaceae bacterium]|nr:PKD domain-containing protein [Cyclobacteriaceae bacterium]